MIKKVSKSRLIFMNGVLFLLCAAWLVACAIQTFDLVWLGQYHNSTGRLLGFSPLAAIGAFWTTRSLVRLRTRELRLEADETGVRWIYINGENWAAWDSLSAWRLSPRTPTAIEADITGTNVSSKLLGESIFGLSARLLDMEGSDLAAELNKIGRKAFPRNSTIPEEPQSSSPEP